MGREKPQSKTGRQLAAHLLRTGRADEAEEAMREVVDNLVSYQPGDMILCVRYHRALGQEEEERVAYYAGLKYFALFAADLRNEDCAPPAGTTKKIPADIEKQFLRYLAKWLDLTPRQAKARLKRII